jgi:cytochrome c peroxidase
MQTGKRPVRLFLLLMFLSVIAPEPAGTAVGGPSDTVSEEPITPVSITSPIDTEKAELGERLFHDVRLSHGDAISCATCHKLAQGGDDGVARSVSADGTPLQFNAPTIFNVSFDFRLNWRGNFRTLEEQNEAALLDKTLMNMTWQELLAKMNADADYARRFKQLYSSPPERVSVLDALATYQRSLTTPNARFDRYLRGDRNAITPEEARGYELFKSYGCIACHQGVNVGGNLFQKFGIFADPFAAKQATSEADLGRFVITGRESDRHVFRVPSLRNVAVTAPYFHDGRTASLDEAIRIMAQNQLGRELTDGDVQAIVKFLRTLTGEYRGRPLSRDAEDPPK